MRYISSILKTKCTGRCHILPSLFADGAWVRLLLFLMLLLPVGAVAQNSQDPQDNQDTQDNNTTTNTQTTPTTPTITGVRIGGSVFGGARQADINGHTFVKIGAQNHDVIINAVYGGNDISGTIGYSTKPNGVDTNNHLNTTELNTYNAFVRTEKETNSKHLFIAQLFGGGYGDYNYADTDTQGLYNLDLSHTVWNPEGKPQPTEDDYGPATQHLANITKPNLAKTFVDLHGGTFGYVYGGGDNVTVTNNTQICISNESTVWDLNGEDGDTNEDLTDDVLSDNELIDMKINTVYFDKSGKYHFSRVFGGNNKAPMAIMPTWHLDKGSIENLYSGGNEGEMTSEKGLLLEIVSDSQIKVENVYGGCRKADVHPKLATDGSDAPFTTVDLTDIDPQTNERKYKFPIGLAARVLIRGGDINNVYGGNDVKGRVYGGNAVGVYHSIRGNIYGGGNGSYAYTDNYALRNDLKWGDFCYNLDNTTYTGLTSVAALNEVRPDAEQVSIRVYGTENNQTIIGGSIYVGGNSATLAIDTEKLGNEQAYPNYPLVELKVGSYVTATEVFLGNNGREVVSDDILSKYAPDAVKAAKGVVVRDQNGLAIEDFSQIDLRQDAQMKKYMEGVAMDIKPKLSFDKIANQDPADYIDYTTKFGSLYLGGNVGSMTYEGTNQMNFDAKVIIFEKVVGGCNDANVNGCSDADVSSTNYYNHRYEGGILGSSDETNYTTNNEPDGPIKDRLILNFDGLEIQPMRWAYDNNGNKTELVWNTVKWNTHSDAAAEYENVTPNSGVTHDYERRLDGGNVFGGCHNSGHVNGNVVINIKQDLVVKSDVFASPKMKMENEQEVEDLDEDGYQQIDTNSPRNSGVLLYEQGNDVMGTALNVFGAGYGEDSEIWGSVTINLIKGYALQLFGGGMKGVVGRKNSEGNYAYDARYSTYINLCGSTAGSSDGTGLAEAEYLYGGGYEGPVCGDTHVNLGNGRIYDAIAGACIADIYGHTELYIGGNGEYETIGEGEQSYKKYIPYGFPYVRDNVYGGNDFGGRIGHDSNPNNRIGDYTDFVRPQRRSKVFDENLLRSQTYVAYIQGCVDSIFGGNYGEYHYANELYRTKYTNVNGDPLGSFVKPHIDNSFVNFQPVDNAYNHISVIFGSSQGNAGEKTNNNSMQERSYILVDDYLTADETQFENVDIYGGGAYGGVGTRQTPGGGYTVIDLFQGRVHNVYGGSNREGLLGSTRVNVPDGSTIHVNALFGGGQGYDPTAEGVDLTAFCDTYVACIDYQSATAAVDDAIYGGNQNCRIACDTYINITKPIKNSAGELVEVFGAGYGSETVSGRTNVFLQNGSEVRRVYGGGRDGNVYNFASLTAWLRGLLIAKYAANTSMTDEQRAAAVEADATEYKGYLIGFAGFISGNPNANPVIQPHPIVLPTGTGTYVNSTTHLYDRTFTNDILAENPTFHNTNVHIFAGAEVKGNPRPTGGTEGGYAYGAGWGSDAVVAGTTYIELLGGTVEKDLSGGGWGGPVINEFEITSGTGAFVAGTNVYIKGGTVRNVYGGGYQGNVGYTEMTITPVAGSNKKKTATIDKNIPGTTNVVIGVPEDATYIDGMGAIPVSEGVTQFSYQQGIPAIERSVYGGGEKGAVFGTSNVTIYDGRIGYSYKNGNYSPCLSELIAGQADEDDGHIITEAEAAADESLEMNGNVFGGGYDEGGSVDFTHVTLYGGIIRNSMFGGGEIAAVGRGEADETLSDDGLANRKRELIGIYRPGKTELEMFDGHVKRNVFGGGRGYNTWNQRGQEKFTDGYVFGQTVVHIHGGEVGTEEGVELGEGNVFGGGDIGYVYSAYELSDGTFQKGVKSGVRFDGDDTNAGYEGYYYEHVWENDDTTDENNFIHYNRTERKLTEDCKVLIEPHCKVLTAVTINNTSYAVGQFVPTSALNTMNKKRDKFGAIVDGRWNSLDERGIIIHNAVFAGGNTSYGASNENAYANTTTVLGNATASVHDVYHRDLITIGTGRTGGLYGDGNLTFVDGYRGLNITNYGTDYYNINEEITYEDYQDPTKVTEREKAYYELRYKCVQTCTDDEGTVYNPADPNNPNSKASTLNEDEIRTLFKNGTNTQGVITANGTINSAYWVINGVCSRYAGRIMNTIQRADFCGVFGSRMVMQGAQDRTVETVDYTNYTINRVRELSLNKKNSLLSTAAPASADQSYLQEEGTETYHGNYFGIYSVVNYLGALTSDVDFHTAIRTSDNSDHATYQADIKDGNKTYHYGDANYTFYNWKKANYNYNTRNNGNSYNQVALASGVYLELTTEKSTGSEYDQKVWGPITGVVELDLINVQTGVGGGFVYAKNVHGVATETNIVNTTLTELNRGAATRWDYSYPAATDTPNPSQQMHWETSGNFVHSTQTIIDDCYNVSNKYDGSDRVPAHYWYIKGKVYVYDQEISAYTGAPSAYKESVNIPLTITAASHGKMTLLNVQPNKYAFYKSDNVPLESGQKLIINDVTYYKNDPISYWDWSLLSAAERGLFVDETYLTVADCKITIGQTETTYEAGTVLLASSTNSGVTTYASLKASAPTKVLKEGEPAVPYVTLLKKDDNNQYVAVKDVAFDEVFHPSNNLSHDNGYILTYTVNNPKEWNTWYTEYKDAANDQDEAHEKNLNKGDLDEEYETIAGTDLLKGPNNGPTYRLKNGQASTLLGQQNYVEGNVIDNDLYVDYNSIAAANLPTGQASFERAYIVKEDILDATKLRGKNAGQPINLHEGATVAKWQYTDTNHPDWPSNMAGLVEEAWICTNTIQLSNTQFLYVSDKISTSQRNAYIAAYPDLAEDFNEYVVPAWYCITDGKYGGNYFQTGYNYRGLEAWSALSDDDHEMFDFNYDALDLLIDEDYGGTEGKKYQYDSSAATLAGAQANDATYSLQRSVDYNATFEGSKYATETDADGIKYMTYTKADGTTVVTVKVGAELIREEFEAIPNEQYHYSPIAVKTAGTYHVVNTGFTSGDKPFAAGQVLTNDEYTKLSGSSDWSRVSSFISDLVFTADDHPGEDVTYYFCRDSYTINHNGEGRAVKNLKEGSGISSNGENVTLTANQEFSLNSEVPVGVVISSTEYDLLPNKQLGFTIHGVAPIETSTLYVSRYSDINDLSTEKIITVIYQYDYEESDESGAHITPVSERHVLNIHIKFKSGVPTVGDINKPKIVIPGYSVSIKDPIVTPGAQIVTGGGWKLFENETDYENRENGIEYRPTIDPLYWYQDGYLLAYYAKTILGETYSNYQPVSVANYHDLTKVMNSPEHHYYVDRVPNNLSHPDCKIYVTDAANGMSQLKDFFDLSILQNPATTNGLINSGTFQGHAPLDDYVAGGQNIDFIMQTNVTMPSGSSWTPIANNPGECFAGTLHGDGHYINGLDHSVFNHLCGSVYNLGVMGSFSSAGVADTGTGYVENCWITTTGTPDGSVRAVFGNPTATSGTKIVNCYYPETKNYLTTDNNNRGLARPMPEKAFYNGEVAYDLNGFYLYKRYFDQKAGTTGTPYKYYIAGVTDPTTNRLDPKTEYYEENVTLCSSGAFERDDQGNIKKDKNGNPIPIYTAGGYVEDRYADGDFRYAGGYIPSKANDRLYIDENNNSHFYPIWPDDYIFFGQNLTFNQLTGESYVHEVVPSPIIKDAVGIINTEMSGNRVYRAPAYYRNSTMSVAHFNKYAVFSKTDKNYPSKIAYKDMTAIDFTGCGDTSYLLGANESNNGWFYQPLLDDDGLTGFRSFDLTKNLLVYTGTDAMASATTDALISTKLPDPTYATYYSNDNYRSVDYADPSSIIGHWVQKNEGSYTYTTTTDHLLVDAQDFFCPISYTMGDGKHIWYQRAPKNFVDLEKGWEDISLPFIAELVTTNQKGEITHFYSGSYDSYNRDEPVTSTTETNTKVGHEYWLREYEDLEPLKETAAYQNSTPEEQAKKIAEALFQYPDALADTDNNRKIVKNSFLWDYYYNAPSGHNHHDKNKDDVYQTYYQPDATTGIVHTFNGYPLLANGTPYIIGFPGKTYYEFDLSGNFEALTTNTPNPDKLGEQTISFVSNAGYQVLASDEDILDANNNSGVTHNGYTFYPSYLNMEFDAGTDYYTLKADGSEYVKVPATGTTTTKVAAFRPYFVRSSTKAPAYDYIVFSNEATSLQDKDIVPDLDENIAQSIKAYPKRNKIVVESALRDETVVQIYSAGGALIDTYTLKPGDTNETTIYSAGAYIVRAANGRFTKKLSVK